MSTLKEPCFWSRDLEAGWGIKDRAAYDALWADARPGALRGEASPVYLQSRVAIPDLLAARPDVRLIAMIRNPVEMVVSRHANLYRDRVEDLDLETAWRMQERRARGEALPAACPIPAVFQYRAYAAIGDYIERFFERVPADQRIVIVYDDFRAQPRAQYLRALALLELEDDGRAEFSPVMQHYTPIWRRLPDLQARWSRRHPRLYRAGRAVAHAVGLSPAAMNRRPARHAALRLEFERELIAEFRPQVEKLERLLGRDLAAWKTPRGG